MTTLKKMVHQNEKGMVLVVALLLMGIMAAMTAVAILVSTSEKRAADGYKARVQAFYVAEAGSEFGFNKLRDALQVLNPTIPTTAPTISGYIFSTYSVQTTGTPSTLVIQSGPYSGLTGFITTYQITSKANKTGTYASAQVAVTVRDELIPAFQFGVFYNDILELLPGANMTFSGYSGMGRIHSNSDMYLGAYTGSTLSVNVPVTTAGSLYNRRLDDGSVPGGTIRIQDASATYHNLTSTTDSSSATWRTDSQTTWLGNVKSGVNGITPLNVPSATGSSNPIDIIGDSTGAADNMYHKAGLRIVVDAGGNVTAKDRNDNTVDISGVNNPVSTTTFYDGREARTMTATTIDITKLRSNTNALNALNTPPTIGGSLQDANILYVSSSLANPAVKLINGSTLPILSGSSPSYNALTVASKNPVYIKGDYNTLGTTNNTFASGTPVYNPAAIIADAVTVLSNNWNDANASLAIGSRTATATTVNAAIMAGNKNTSGTQYSGGVENLIRFLENWTGVNINYGGSLFCLWQSAQAIGNQPSTGSVYTAPTRNWIYNINMNKLPPGTPRVRYTEKIIWSKS
ncbi:MAG: pilus assembly PilX N-terminal domain-containing protein [Syntrophales bacterium LBB04]|nr:pilus assembly PilX N-terminal domain-containing protein [Syntrophales bacterium LBB04]